MGSGGVSLLYRREKGKTRMGEETYRGKRERLGKRKGGKGKGKGKGRGNGRLSQKGWGLTGGGVFFLTGKKFFSSWRNLFWTLSSNRMLEEWLIGVGRKHSSARSELSVSPYGPIGAEILSGRIICLQVSRVGWPSCFLQTSFVRLLPHLVSFPYRFRFVIGG